MLDGDTPTVAFSEPGKERPTAFGANVFTAAPAKPDRGESDS